MPQICIYLVLLFVLPARLVVQGLGAAGRPAYLWGLGLLALWLLGRLRRARHGSVSPISVLLAVWLGVFLVTYATGALRGLPDIEASGADRAVLNALSWLGVALTVQEVRTREAFETVWTWLVGSGVFLALIGCVQFFFQFDPVPFIRIPGLVLNDSLLTAGERGGPGFLRIGGTTAHYIEYGVILAMLVPLALHRVLFDSGSVQRRRNLLAAATICLGIPLSISRSAFVVLGIIGLVLVSVWPLVVTARAAAGALIFLLAMQAVVPGLLGTIRSLFKNPESDPSIQGRTEDYDFVVTYVQARPWFGRGPGTFLPERYQLLDNEFLGTAAAQGILGLLALLTLFLGAFLVARGASRRSVATAERNEAQALASAVLGALVALVTFDGFSFTTFAGTTFLLIGLIGARWRLDTAK